MPDRAEARARRSPSWPARPGRARAQAAPSPPRSRPVRPCGRNAARSADELAPLRLDDDEARAVAVDQRRARACLPSQDRAARRLPAPPARARCAGRRRASASCAASGSSRSRMRCSSCGPCPCSRGASARAPIRRNVRHLRNAVDQRAEIEPGAADEDRPPAGKRAFVDQARDVAQPGAGRIGDRRDGHGRRARAARASAHRQLGRAVSTSSTRIDLHGIGVDDDAALALGDIQRQRRLAARGRPRYQDRVLDAVPCLFPPESSMPLVATLISHPHSRALSPAWRIWPRGSSAQAKSTGWPTAVACDLTLPGRRATLTAEATLRAALAAEPIDIVVQDGADRRKKILIADMDSTMIDQECIDELADEVGIKAAGRGHHRALDEWRDRLRAGAARARRAAQGPRRVGRRPRSSNAASRWPRAAASWSRTMRAPRRLDGARFRRLRRLHRPDRREDRLSTRTAPTRLLESGGRLAGVVAEPILGRAAKAEALTRNRRRGSA